MTTENQPDLAKNPARADAATASGSSLENALEARTSFSADTISANTLGEYLRGYRNKLRAGDFGVLPALFGLLVLVIVFAVLASDDGFVSARNFANLLTQAGSICVLAMGVGFVLLLGHIDLAAGVTGGVGAAAMAMFMLKAGMPWYLAVIVSLIIGVVMGLISGFLVTKVGIPSFVVTLAFFLAWQGVLLWIIGAGGTVPINDTVISAVANKNLPVVVGWVVVIVCIALYAALNLLTWSRRRAKKLVHPPLAVPVLRIVGIAVLLVLATWWLSVNRAVGHSTVVLAGIPWVVPIVAVLLVIWTFVQQRTAFGRYVYAVGGNAEAARRAGIRVAAITIACFVIASAMAVLSGIINASRLNSVTPDAGAGNTLLYAVAAAVIGGTSLFGGKGKAMDAIIGGLMIAIIPNGLGLLGSDAKINYILTGVVLLVAASVDALTRRRRASTGR